MLTNLPHAKILEDSFVIVDTIKTHCSVKIQQKLAGIIWNFLPKSRAAHAFGFLSMTRFNTTGHEIKNSQIRAKTLHFLLWKQAKQLKIHSASIFQSSWKNRGKNRTKSQVSLHSLLFEHDVDERARNKHNRRMRPSNTKKMRPQTSKTDGYGPRYRDLKTIHIVSS
jgi:hypothetical protein